ncbi:MAG: hypothetical protein K6E77_12035 [Lachnospiraceae bacterium]|nr:hypothetical protein [Lachnospiraceae bacterium]
MSRVYRWLDRRSNESSDAYDNRINHLAAFHAGYAFFARGNYNPEISGFAAYILWNGEFNSKLFLHLPDGGYMIHCSRDEAIRLSYVFEGLPVYVKIKSYHGRLRAEHLAVDDRGVFYDLYYNGCDVKVPDDLYFVSRRAFEEHPENEAAKFSPNSSYTPGSYINRPKKNAGSYIGGSYSKGSYSKGSYNTGSYGTGSYISGSFMLSSFLLSMWSRYLSGGRNIGSYRLGSYISGLSSFMSGSFLRSLYKQGSYLGGSYLNTGSYYLKGGSFFRNGSFVCKGSFFDPHMYIEGSAANEGNKKSTDNNISRLMESGIRPAKSGLRFIPEGKFRPSYRCIAEMGYGLDLI